MKSVLASASWDRTVRLWDMADSWRTTETLALTSDGKRLPGTGGKARSRARGWIDPGLRAPWAVGVGGLVLSLGIGLPQGSKPGALL